MSTVSYGVLDNRLVMQGYNMLLFQLVRDESVLVQVLPPQFRSKLTNYVVHSNVYAPAKVELNEGVVMLELGSETIKHVFIFALREDTSPAVSVDIKLQNYIEVAGIEYFFTLIEVVPYTSRYGRLSLQEMLLFSSKREGLLVFTSLIKEYETLVNASAQVKFKVSDVVKSTDILQGSTEELSVLQRKILKYLSKGSSLSLLQLVQYIYGRDSYEGRRTLIKSITRLTNRGYKIRKEGEMLIYSK